MEGIQTDAVETVMSTGSVETEEDVIQTDAVETVMADVGSVETEEDVIQTDAVETVMADVGSVETEEDVIQTDAVETVTKGVVWRQQRVVMTAVTLDEVVNERDDERPNERYRKARGKDRAMHTTVALNPYDLDAIKTKIETIEVN